MSDTDSICLGLSKTNPITLNSEGNPSSRLHEMESIFFPIVKPSLLAEFKQTWHKWFVLSNEIEDEKCPGLLKAEFSSSNAEIVALCPKNYQIRCRTKGFMIILLIQFSYVICRYN